LQLRHSDKNVRLHFPVSSTATIRATRVFTKWTGDPGPWDQAESAPNGESDWNSFGRCKFSGRR